MVLADLPDPVVGGATTAELRATTIRLRMAPYACDSYVANFDTYSGQRFEVAPVVRAAGSDRVVETQIAAASGQGYVLDYVMRQESGGWKVVDVLVDGAISRVAAQRSEMRSMLADSGGAGLLVGLRQKTADLSGGILQ